MFLKKNKIKNDGMIDLGVSASDVESADKPASEKKNVGQAKPAVQRNFEAERLEKEWLHRVHEKLMNAVDMSQLVNMQERAARTQIREITQKIIEEEAIPLQAAARVRIVKGVEDEILGLGPLEPLLADPSVADILINGSQSIFVERKGVLEKSEITFRDDTHLLHIIDRIVSNVGRRIDESSPMVDARLKDGSRVNAIIPPLAIDGPSMSIRRFTVDRLGVDQLLENDSISNEIAEVLSGVVRSRLNVLVSGGTGSGKTTLLNILSGFISAKERVVTIEDSAELQLQQPHVVRLETRPANIEAQGEVNQRDLVKNSLRMRPDRIIIGEVRGGEALDMLQAMNTGHDGSLATVHANNPRDALGRIENMVSMSGLSLPMSAIRSQIASAIDVVVQLERMEDGKRRVTSVQEIQGMEGEIITLSEIFSFQRKGMDEDGNVRGRFISSGLVPVFTERMRERGYDVDLSLFKADEETI